MTINLSGQPRKPRTTKKPVVHQKLSKKRGGLQCYLCADWLTPESFAVDTHHRAGRCTTCKVCQKVRRVEMAADISLRGSKYYAANRDAILTRNLRWQADHPEHRLLSFAQRRAKQLGVPCTITVKDIVIPETCPALGFPLVRNLGTHGTGKFNSPSIDRFIPRLGYVPTNIQVISRQANIMKGAYSLADLENFSHWILNSSSALKLIDRLH